MTEIPKKISLRFSLALLVWLTLTIGLAALAYRDHQEELRVVEAAMESVRTGLPYAGPNPEHPEGVSFMHLNPYLLAVIGVAGTIVVAAMLAKDSERTLKVLGIDFLWEAFPTACWVYSVWDGPSDFFAAAEIAALVVAPIAAGIVHRSWKVTAASVGLPIIACGLMWAGFIWLMGNGK